MILSMAPYTFELIEDRRRGKYRASGIRNVRVTVEDWTAELRE